MQLDSEHKGYELLLAFARKALRKELLFLLLHDEEFKQFLQNAIAALKTVEEETPADLLLDSTSVLTKRKIYSKIGWLLWDHALLKFHMLLSIHGYTACNFEIFKLHFVGDEQTQSRLIWLSHTKKLVYLFDQLIVNGLVPESQTPHQLICEHFYDKRGNALKNGSLRSSLNSVRNNKSIRIIDNIIIELNKKS